MSTDLDLSLCFGPDYIPFQEGTIFTELDCWLQQKLKKTPWPTKLVLRIISTWQIMRGWNVENNQ